MAYKVIENIIGYVINQYIHSLPDCSEELNLLQGVLILFNWLNSWLSFNKDAFWPKLHIEFKSKSIIQNKQITLECKFGMLIL